MFLQTNNQKTTKNEKKETKVKSEVQILFWHATLHLGAHKFLFKCDKTKMCS